MPVSLSRRSRVIGGVVVLVVALAGVLVAVTRGGHRPEVSLSAPAYTADPVPKPRVLRESELPEGCGVRSVTVRRYAPGGDDDDGKDRTHCHWYAQNDGEKVRDLDVEISLGDEPPKPSPGGGDALRTLEPEAEQLVVNGKAQLPVSGLGDEALYRYSPALSTTHGGASLVFRVGTALVGVTYNGGNHSTGGPTRQVPEKEARAAVLAAAGDTAHALHAPAKPAFTQPRPAAGPAPVRRVPRPCDLVPHAVADRLAPGAIRRGRPSPPASAETKPYGLTADACAWDSLSTCCLGEDTGHRSVRHLLVTVTSVSEWRRGIAVSAATRLYLERHEDARQGAPRGFRAVRGLGDQAYAAYRGDTSGALNSPGGEVAFRFRNVVVQVDYTGEADHPLDRNTALTGAYTAAVHARDAFQAA